MNRRDFLIDAALLGGATLLPLNLGLGRGRTLQLPAMKFSWQGHKTTRPFAMDSDSDGKVWFGSAERFFCYDPVTRTSREIDSAPMRGIPYSTCLCQQKKVYILGQKTPFLHVYDSETQAYRKYTLPDPESNIWFGVRVPGDPAMLPLHASLRESAEEGGSGECGLTCKPHSFAVSSSHHQRPDRKSSPTAIARVHGSQPMLGMKSSCSGLYGTCRDAM